MKRKSKVKHESVSVRGEKETPGTSGEKQERETAEDGGGSVQREDDEQDEDWWLRSGCGNIDGSLDHEMLDVPPDIESRLSAGYRHTMPREPKPSHLEGSPSFSSFRSPSADVTPVYLSAFYSPCDRPVHRSIPPLTDPHAGSRLSDRCVEPKRRREKRRCDGAKHGVMKHKSKAKHGSVSVKGEKETPGTSGEKQERETAEDGDGSVQREDDEQDEDWWLRSGCGKIDGSLDQEMLDVLPDIESRLSVYSRLLKPLKDTRSPSREPKPSHLEGGFSDMKLRYLSAFYSPCDRPVHRSIPPLTDPHAGSCLSDKLLPAADTLSSATSASSATDPLQERWSRSFFEEEQHRDWLNSFNSTSAALTSHQSDARPFSSSCFSSPLSSSPGIIYQHWSDFPSSCESPPLCTDYPARSFVGWSEAREERGVWAQTEPWDELHCSSPATSAMLSPPHPQGSATDSRETGVAGRPRRPLSVPTQVKTGRAKDETLARAVSLPDLRLKTSFEEFTPEIELEEEGKDETYVFRCTRRGLYQCSVTGLLFGTDTEGDVVYRIVPWNRRLLTQHRKKPAGPLFDIKCVQQSVCELHLPHSEIRSAGGGRFLSVAHVNNEDVEFMAPHQITETHVVVKITGLSGFGTVMDEGSSPDPVRALVLLFHRPPADLGLESVITVLLLPRNIVLRDVLRARKRLNGDERYLETSPHCKLHPDQVYTLSTCPNDDLVVVQPTEAEFDCDNYDNYFPSFQVILKGTLKDIKLVLRDPRSSRDIWERQVCLLNPAQRSSVSNHQNVSSRNTLMDMRDSFVEGVSGPVLKVLLDKLLKINVIRDCEMETANETANVQNRARFVIDTVRKKGEAASSQMIEILRELDPFLCEHLGLT